MWSCLSGSVCYFFNVVSLEPGCEKVYKEKRREDAEKRSLRHERTRDIWSVLFVCGHWNVNLGRDRQRHEWGSGHSLGVPARWFLKQNDSMLD
jgi:hypothetical protein